MAPHVLESRAHQGRKLRAMYRSLGWSRADCAKFLHVTERCLRNWETGRHAVPFAALKLMRLHLRYDLPGKDWEGWHIAAGKLWTPEGHGLNPLDAKWWSMLHRRAETGWLALRRLALYRQTGEAATPAADRTSGAGAEAAGAAAKPNVFDCDVAVSAPALVGSPLFGAMPNERDELGKRRTNATIFPCPPSCNTGGKYPIR